jgi:hypothetical protein
VGGHVEVELGEVVVKRSDRALIGTHALGRASAGLPHAPRDTTASALQGDIIAGDSISEIAASRRRAIEAGVVPENEGTRRLDAHTGRMQVVCDSSARNGRRLPFSTEWVPLLRALPEDNQAVCDHLVRTEFGMAKTEALEG